MSAETSIIDVPVYRLSPEQHEAALEKAADRFVGDIMDNPSVPHHMVNSERQRFRHEKAAPWLFNEVVGWVRVYALGTQIRGQTYFAVGKKLCLAPQKRRIRDRGKAFEKNFHPDDSNEDIGASVLAAVERLKRERLFKRRYIDVTCLLSQCQYFNWRRVLFNG